jgi:hypothetical protein
VTNFVIELMIASIMPAFITAASRLIALRWKLDQLNDRHKREIERYKLAVREVRNALDRLGETGASVMGDTQVQLLRATALEPRRGLFERIRLWRLRILSLQERPHRQLSASPPTAGAQDGDAP